MANRITLVVDTTDGNKIKELPIRDNPDPQLSLLMPKCTNTNTSQIGGTAFTGSYTDLTNTPITADTWVIQQTHKVYWDKVVAVVAQLFKVVVD